MIANAVRWLAALAAAATVVACGGGLVAGVGSGGSGFGLAAGTVTGFGSIVVDGKPWDVRDARIEAQVDPTQPPALAEARLGQRVEIDFQTSGTANAVRIEPNAVGRVMTLPVGNPPASFMVAGQHVVINADPARGPVTILVGYASFADVKLDDVVEVHGSALRGIIAPGHDLVDQIQASRIEKLPALPAGMMRVAGVVEKLQGSLFQLGLLNVDVTRAQIVPASRRLANGQRVVVWGREPLTTGRTLNADFVRIEDAPSGASAGEIAGTVAGFDGTRSTFELNGIAVDAHAALVVPAGQALADGVYVVATGTFLADGSLSAAQVRIRKLAPGDAAVELRGVITGFAGAANFTVRGVTVDASAATLNGCANTPLANGLFLEVGGNVAGSVVKAVSVTCDATPPADATLTFRGTANSVDVAARTFTLTIAGAAARPASWTDSTLFVDVTPATLAGQAIELEGFVRQGVLVATKIRPAG